MNIMNMIVGPNLRNAASLSVFKNNLLKFIRMSPNNVFNCHNCKGTKILTRLRFGLSHLRAHKFKHSFQDTLNLFCSCGLDIETGSIYPIDSPLKNITESSIIHILLFDKALQICQKSPLNLMQLRIISYRRRDLKEVSLVFCNLLLYVHPFQFFSVSSHCVKYRNFT